MMAVAVRASDDDVDLGVAEIEALLDFAATHGEEEEEANE